jgi:hypothetical protein
MVKQAATVRNVPPVGDLVKMTLFFLAVTAHTALAAQAPLSWLSPAEYPEAKCLDGTPAGYYYQPASRVEDSNKWVIYLAGGGECDTEAACKSQTTNALGSSKYFGATSEASWW